MGSFDVVIVGSGFGGSIPALRLAEAGRSVMVFEKGRRYASEDFRFSWDPRYLQDFLAIQPSDDYSVFFRFARILGGGSVVFSGAMLRSPSEVFDYEDAGGNRLWPASLDRQALDPYYDTVEEMMEVSQARWDEVPRPGGVFAMMLDAMGLTCDRGRFPYVDCLQCGFCETGCQFGRKRSLMFNYIPAAEELGVTFTPEADVRRIEPSGGGYRVQYTDRFGAQQEVSAQRVIVAAGAIESPALLLRSADVLTNLSAEVGRNLNNNGDLPWFWMLPEDRFPSFSYFKGRNNAVMISYAFWDDHRITIHTGCGPPAIIAGADVHRESGPGSIPWGLDHKHLMHDIYPGRMVGAMAIGLVPAVGQVTVDTGGNPSVSLPMTPELQAYVDRVMGVAQQIGDANGAEVLRVIREGVPYGDAHPLGTCRMGEKPASSVVDPFGEVYGHPGLYITDGSTIPTGTGVNPSLTIAANAERIAEAVVAAG